VLASPFKSKLRLEAENAMLRGQEFESLRARHSATIQNKTTKSICDVSYPTSTVLATD
jgi:hypothetical protein